MAVHWSTWPSIVTTAGTMARRNSLVPSAYESQQKCVRVKPTLLPNEQVCLVMSFEFLIDAPSLHFPVLARIRFGSTRLFACRTVDEASRWLLIVVVERTISQGSGLHAIEIASRALFWARLPQRTSRMNSACATPTHLSGSRSRAVNLMRGLPDGSGHCFAFQ